MLQVSMKRSMKKWGKWAEDAVSNDLKMLHMREALLPISPSHIIEEEKTAFMEHLMFLKEKGDFYIKARGCEDGKNQR